MSKNSKTLITIAVLFILVGGIIFVVSGCLLGWDFSKFGANDFTTKTIEINEDFSSITIDTETSDIEFKPSLDGKCKIVCFQQVNNTHSGIVQGDLLTISGNDNRRWYEKLFNVKSPKITVFLPKIEYSSLVIKQSTGDVEIPNSFKFDSVDVTVSTGDVKILSSVENQIKINSTTGDVSLENLTTKSISVSLSTGDVNLSSVNVGGDLSINVSTGKTRLNSVNINNLITNGSTGDVILNNVIATNKFTIERSTGDVKFNSCDASEIFVETDTGDVTGTLLTSKIFIVTTDTGDKDVPSSTSGGKCEIITDTGDVEIRILN